MIRVVASTSGISAKAYFSSGLVRADYYTDEIIGKWHGVATHYLGLAGEVEEIQFARLIENQHPLTEEKLNPRVGRSRTVGWDINFHAPKSVSLAISLNGDRRLLQALRDSVAETMADIERQTETRIRKNGASEDRPTGNLCWAEFVHLTARPVGGIPDPHAHIHAYVFNTTFDLVEKRWKAAKIKAARREMPLHQARFHARLALRVKQLGYQTKRTRTGWELTGIDRPTLDKFSRRSAEIERVADELQLTSDASRDKLGALTREGKRKGLGSKELIQAWLARLSNGEKEQLAQLRRTNNGPVPVITAEEAMNHAIEKVFARDAVVRRSRLLAEAIRYGVGHLSPHEVETEYQKRPIWEKDYQGDVLVTHQSVLEEEIALVNFVRSGRGKHCSLVPGHPRITREYLSDEQKAAVRHVLASNDRVIAIRGGAGTGKTTTMQEIVEAIEMTGTKVFALAPSSDASRDTLRKAGFEKADTVAQFLTNPKFHEEAKGQVVWVDEAGLLGTRDLHALSKKAGEHTRIILTGDTFQHAPVARGNAFRNLQEFAGLRPIEIHQIRRQEPKTYREAVYDLSKKDLANAFLKLDAIGAIREIEDPANRYAQIARDYIQLSTGKQAPLVVSPTRAEGSCVTSAIRIQLKENETLKEENAFVRYRNLQWESADKKEPENYFPGAMIQYHQNAKGIKRGARFFVTEVTNEGKIMVKENDSSRTLNPLEADKFQVFSSETISLAINDRLRITRNGFSRNKVRHSNGNQRVIESFTPDGHIKLTTGAILDKNDGHWDYGYCTTSHSSQSKSVRDVLIAQSTESSPAASEEQFYVSVSRGKQRVRIYTDDRKALQEAVGISEKSRSALQLAKDGGRNWNAAIENELDRNQWRELLREKAPSNQLTKEKELQCSHASWLKALDGKRQNGRNDFNKANTKRGNAHAGATLMREAKAIQKFRDCYRRVADWMKPGNILRSAQKRYRQIRTFKPTPQSVEKTRRNPSVKSPRKAIVRRPNIRN